jgi:hypothetical protein
MLARCSSLLIILSRPILSTVTRRRALSKNLESFDKIQDNDGPNSYDDEDEEKEEANVGCKNK